MKPETLSFFDKVYDVAKRIPYGRVTNYGAIAKYLGAALIPIFKSEFFMFKVQSKL